MSQKYNRDTRKTHIPYHGTVKVGFKMTQR